MNDNHEFAPEYLKLTPQERREWFEANEILIGSLKSTLASKDAEIERLKGALKEARLWEGDIENVNMPPISSTTVTSKIVSVRKGEPIVDDCYAEMVEGQDSAVIIERLQSQLTALREKHRWIKIEEGLPEGQLVLVRFVVYHELGLSSVQHVVFDTRYSIHPSDLFGATHYLKITPPDTEVQG